MNCLIFFLLPTVILNHIILKLVLYLPIMLYARPRSGFMLLLKSMPLQIRSVTSLAIASSHAFFTVGKRASDSALKSKIANETLKSASNSGFKACSIIEEKWDVYFQSEYFIFLVCFLLIILVLISFTVIVFWVIIYKYNSWVVFLNKKTQNKLVFTCIEKIKSIRENQLLPKLLVLRLQLKPLKDSYNNNQI